MIEGKQYDIQASDNSKKLISFHVIALAANILSSVSVISIEIIEKERENMNSKGDLILFAIVELLYVAVKKTSVLSMLYIMNQVVNNVETDLILVKIKADDDDQMTEIDTSDPEDKSKKHQSLNESIRVSESKIAQER